MVTSPMYPETFSRISKTHTYRITVRFGYYILLVVKEFLTNIGMPISVKLFHFVFIRSYILNITVPFIRYTMVTMSLLQFRKSIGRFHLCPRLTSSTSPLQLTTSANFYSDSSGMRSVRSGFKSKTKRKQQTARKIR